MRGTLWILGEYCETADDIQALTTLVRQLLGDLPIVDDELRRAAGIENSTEEDELILKSNQTHTSQVQQLVTADGTYATQSAFVMNSQANSQKKALDEADNRPTLRGFLLNGHFFIAAALARTLTKLSLKYVKLAENEPVKQNRFVAEAMFIMASVLHYGKSGMAKKAINEDDTDSINVCLRIGMVLLI